MAAQGKFALEFMIKRGWLTAGAVLSLVCNALGIRSADSQNDDVGSAHYLKLFYGQSVLVFETEDRRTMSGIEYGYGKPDKRLAFMGHPAQFVSEIKFDYSRASGNFPGDPSSDLALGAIFSAHYEFPWTGETGYYADWGGGLESVNHSSNDLPLSLNGALFIGAGYFTPLRGSTNRLLVGLRYFHISNGGRKLPNNGQNQIQATIGLKF